MDVSSGFQVSCHNITDIRELGWDSMDWIHPAQDGDQWRAFVKMDMNLRVP
jgi:hypothetical protein